MFRRLICVLAVFAWTSVHAEEVKLSDQERFYGVYPGMPMEKAIEVLRGALGQRHPSALARFKSQEWLRPDGQPDGVFTVEQQICDDPCQQSETMEVTATPAAMGGHVSRVILNTKAAGAEAFQRTTRRYAGRLGAPKVSVDSPLPKRRAWEFNGDGVLEITLFEPDGEVMLLFESAALQGKVRQAFKTYRYR